MFKILLLGLFFLISILTFSAHEIAATSQIEGLTTSKQQRTQRTSVGYLHAVQHTMVSKKSKTVYGGANNVKSHKGKSSANTNLIKSSSLFMVVLSHLILAMILVGGFF
ncbi:unnamed protein product [Lathyrus sativus]|nr:unnamed protein product [Lathyrus sativus]